MSLIPAQTTHDSVTFAGSFQIDYQQLRQNPAAVTALKDYFGGENAPGVEDQFKLYEDTYTQIQEGDLFDLNVMGTGYAIGVGSDNATDPGFHEDDQALISAFQAAGFHDYLASPLPTPNPNTQDLPIIRLIKQFVR